MESISIEQPTDYESYNKALSLDQDREGNRYFLINNRTGSYGQYQHHLRIIRLNSDNSIGWEKIIEDARGTDLYVINSTNLVISSQDYNFFNGTEYINANAITHISTEGEILRRTLVHNLDQIELEGKKVESLEITNICSDGSNVSIVEVISWAEYQKGFLVSWMNDSGVVVWEKIFSGYDDVDINSLEINPDSSQILMAGSYDDIHWEESYDEEGSSSTSYIHGIFIVFDLSGEIYLSKDFPPIGKDTQGFQFHDVITDTEGSFYLVGSYRNDRNYPITLAMRKISPTGLVLWDYIYSSLNVYGQGDSAMFLDDDTLVIAGNLAMGTFGEYYPVMTLVSTEGELKGIVVLPQKDHYVDSTAIKEGKIQIVLNLYYGDGFCTFQLVEIGITEPFESLNLGSRGIWPIFITFLIPIVAIFVNHLIFKLDVFNLQYIQGSKNKNMGLRSFKKIAIILTLSFFLGAVVMGKSMFDISPGMMIGILVCTFSLNLLFKLFITYKDSNALLILGVMLFLGFCGFWIVGLNLN